MTLQLGLLLCHFELKTASMGKVWRQTSLGDLPKCSLNAVEKYLTLRKPTLWAMSETLPRSVCNKCMACSKRNLRMSSVLDNPVSAMTLRCNCERLMNSKRARSSTLRFSFSSSCDDFPIMCQSKPLVLLY